jgi:rhodanese-related sulfurtransferase
VGLALTLAALVAAEDSTAAELAPANAQPAKLADVVPAPAGGVGAAGEVFNGNRYLHERYYAGDISAARAYLGSQKTGADKITIVDVRDATEYRNGHPEGARHIPFPRIYQECKPDPEGKAPSRSEDGGSCRFGAVPGSAVGMNPKDLFDAFEAAYPDKTQALALLCRTGSRSAKAANILSRPEKYLGASYAGRGYQRVTNIWEGFVGMPVVPVDAESRLVIGTSGDAKPITLEDKRTAAYGFKAAQLDLNKDGKLDNQDLDGWRYHQGLPYAQDMRAELLNKQAAPYYGRD